MPVPFRRPLLPLVLFASLILPWVAFTQLPQSPPRAPLTGSAAFEKIVPRPESSRAFFRPVFCLGEDYPSDRPTEARMERDMAILNELGVHFLRCGFSWHEIEPERGTFKWDHWDRLVRTAREHHVTLLMSVIRQPGPRRVPTIKPPSPRAT